MDDGNLQWSRLTAMYGEMGELELLDLHRNRADLTDGARQVLLAEMGQRGLKAPAEEPEQRKGGPGAGRGLAALVSLHVFSDAIQARRALQELELAEIELTVRDRSTNEDGSVNPGQPVQLQVLVAREDRKRAMEVLRAKLGLFPVLTAEERRVDDGPGEETEFVTTLGFFEDREEAERVVRVLESASIWHRLETEKQEGDDPKGWTVGVNEGDLDRALEAVAGAMELEDEEG